jgi:regulator of RNase E activity RraB
MKVTGGWGEEQINCRNQSSRVSVMAPMKCNGLITALGPGGTWYDGKGTYYDDDDDDSDNDEYDDDDSHATSPEIG